MDDELDTLTELAIAFSLSTWKGPACTCENSDGARVCDMCGKTRPPAGSPTRPSAVEQPAATLPPPRPPQQAVMPTPPPTTSRQEAMEREALAAALAASREVMPPPIPRGNSYTADTDLAIARSLSEIEYAMATPPGAPSSTTSASEVLVVPGTVAPVVVGKHATNLRFLSRKYGVRLIMPPIADSAAPRGDLHLRIEGDNAGAVQVARQEIDRIQHDTATFIDHVNAHLKSRVHVFVDGWNVHNHSGDYQSHELSVKRVVQRIECDRTVVERKLCGSAREGNERDKRMWQAWKEANYDVDIEVRRAGAGEQAVDDRIHAAALFTASKRFEDDRTLILVTGDGNDNHGRTTFPEVVNAALQGGWVVEMYTWRHSCSRKLLDFARNYAQTGRFRLHFLNMWAGELIVPRGHGGGKGGGGKGGNGDGDVNGNGKGKGGRGDGGTGDTGRGGEGKGGGGRGGGGRGGGGRGGVSRGGGSSSLDAPEQFLCPISLQVMNDPVTTADGHAYEREHIEKWLQTNDTSPSTGARLAHKNLTPAIALKQLIADWRSRGGV